MTDFDQLRFTAEHEWVRLEPANDETGAAASATIGITAYAADKLGDVVYVDLPDAGVEIADGAVVGEIESTKSVGELFAPVNGTVLEKNSAVEDSPELVNSDPYGEGWLIRVEYAELPTLLSHADYQALLGDEEASA